MARHDNHPLPPLTPAPRPRTAAVRATPPWPHAGHGILQPLVVALAIAMPLHVLAQTKPDRKSVV